MGSVFSSMAEMEFDMFPYLIAPCVITKAVDAEAEGEASTLVDRGIQTKESTALINVATQTEETRTNPYSIYRVT